MVDPSQLFAVEVTAEGARLILEQFNQSSKKSFHFIEGPRPDRMVRILIKDGTDPAISHASKTWTLDQVDLFYTLCQGVLATNEHSQFRGKKFRAPQFLSEFLLENPTLPEGIWQVTIGPESIALLQRSGFHPRVVCEDNSSL